MDDNMHPEPRWEGGDITSEGVTGELSQLRKWRLVPGRLVAVAAQIIPALRLVQNDWLENVAGHTRADAHQRQSVLIVPDMLLQFIYCQSKLRAGEGVREDKGSIALLGETLR